MILTSGMNLTSLILTGKAGASYYLNAVNAIISLFLLLLQYVALLVFYIRRFSPENKTDIQQHAFLAFGSGNRSCIANRLAMLKIRVAVVKLLQYFRFERTADTPEKVILVIYSYMQSDSIFSCQPK